MTMRCPTCGETTWTSVDDELPETGRYRVWLGDYAEYAERTARFSQLYGWCGFSGPGVDDDNHPPVLFWRPLATQPERYT